MKTPYQKAKEEAEAKKKVRETIVSICWLDFEFDEQAASSASALLEITPSSFVSSHPRLLLLSTQRDESDAAKVYEQFVDSFSEKPSLSSSSSSFVKGETIVGDSTVVVNENPTVYKMQPKVSHRQKQKKKWSKEITKKESMNEMKNRKVELVILVFFCFFSFLYSHSI